MTEKEKIKKIVELWSEIIKLQCGHSPSLTIHRTKIDELSSKEWRFSGGITEDGQKYVTAYPLDTKLSGLTLFD